MNKQRIVLLACVIFFCLNGIAAEKEQKKKKGFFTKAGEGADRAWGKVKKAGKKVGEEVQEVFDPDDEDLVAKRKNKKKNDEDED